MHDLLNVSIGTPQAGAVNFSALHALLHAVLQQLDLQRVEVRWGGGGAAGDRPAEDVDDGEKGEREEGPGARGREAPSPPASSEQTSLLPRVQSCESDLSKVRPGIQDQLKYTGLVILVSEPSRFLNATFNWFKHLL